jgi:hypothetical protein
MDFDGCAPSSSPSSSLSPSSTSTQECSNAIQKIRIESNTQEKIQMFEVQVLDLSGVNTAAGKDAAQSSTFVSKSGRSLDASNAIDGDSTTFSHTNDANSWWEVDLGGLYSVGSVNIKNRWCKDPSDPYHCLCRLSNATVLALDEHGSVSTTVSINNTCGVSEIHFDLPPSTSAPTSSPVFALSCLPNAQKVKLQQEITGLPIQVFEVNVVNSTGANVAEGKTATQSSTFLTTSGRSFDAYRAVDGDRGTFSHTNDANPWLEIDLGMGGEISSVEILNRWCKSSCDPSGCLCRLSGAVLSLVDNLGEQIVSLTIGDTCGQSTLEYVFDPSPQFCPTSSVSFLFHQFEHIGFLLCFNNVVQFAHAH